MPNRTNNSCKEKLIDIDFTELEVQLLFESINSSKSPGSDQIHPSVLKEYAKKLALAPPWCRKYRGKL